jgi:arginase
MSHTAPDMIDLFKMCPTGDGYPVSLMTAGFSRMTIEIVTIPYRYDDYLVGLGRGPQALLEAGLEKRLKAAGIATGSVSEVLVPEDQHAEGPRAANIGRIGMHAAQFIASARANGNPVLVLAGDDTAAIGVIAGLQIAHGPAANIGLIWIDAHADFNTPETTVSGILAGMPVSILAGLAGPIWREAAQLQATIPTDRILIAGARSIEEREEVLLRSTNVRVITTDEVRAGNTFENAVDRLAERVDLFVVNIDLDVLDPTLVPSASTPEPHGLSIKHIARMLKYVISTGKTAVVAVTSLNPGGRQRGERSIESTLALLESSLQDWKESDQDSHAES